MRLSLNLGITNSIVAELWITIGLDSRLQQDTIKIGLPVGSSMYYIREKFLHF